MIKRVSIVLIAAAYLISVSGVSGSNFYCCGKYKESYFFSHIISKTNCKEDLNAKDCCVTKVFFVKVKDNHSPSNELKVNGAETITLLQPFYSEIFHSQNIADDSQSSVLLHPPPLISKLPVYLSNEAFLI